MKRFLSILFVLVLLAAPAFGQDEVTQTDRIFADCTFVEYGGMVTATKDTLWFVDLTGTTYNVAAGIGLADYFPPVSVPIGTTSDGGLIFHTKRAKKVLLYAGAAFGYQAWQNGSSTPSGGADGAAYIWPVASAAGEFAAVVTYPDSLQFAGVAAGDSVRVFVGY